jgi:acyl-coenzyme A thioesterase PaaI-like protein
MTFDKEKYWNTVIVFKNTLMETLNIEYVDAGEDFFTATMPVNQLFINLWDFCTAVPRWLG